jgi:hypothetical protein
MNSTGMTVLGSLVGSGDRGDGGGLGVGVEHRRAAGGGAVGQLLAHERQDVAPVVLGVREDVPAADRQQVAADLGVVDECRGDGLVGADQRGRRALALERPGQRRPQAAVVQLPALGDGLEAQRSDVGRGRAEEPGGRVVGGAVLGGGLGGLDAREDGGGLLPRERVGREEPPTEIGTVPRSGLTSVWKSSNS